MMRDFFIVSMGFYILLLLQSAQPSELDIDGLMSYQRGNSYDTTLGSNVHYKDKHVNAGALYSYSDNSVRVDRRYEVKGNVDFPLHGPLGGFTFAVLGKDSKKHLDNYNKAVVGLGYALYGVKYSIGLGRQQENTEHVFITTHRLKTGYENENWKMKAVAWYIKNPDDYDITVEATCKRKITKALRIGLSVEYSYDSSPVGDSVRGDFLSKFVIGISI